VNIQTIDRTFEIIPDPDPISAPEQPPVLSARGLSKRVGHRLANDRIDLEVRSGEILVLLGDNGSGKSTLIDLLAGAVMPDSGTISTACTKNEADLERVKSGCVGRALAKGVAMVPRRLALAGKLNGLDNIQLGTESFWKPFRNHGIARGKISELKDKLELHVDLSIPVCRLSAGDRFRVALLRTLYRKPRVVLLDEPMAMLTPQDGAILIRALKHLSELGIAVVMATRKPEEAIAVGHRIVVLRGGTKVADVAAETQDQQTLFGFLTGHPINKPTLGYQATGKTILELVKADVESHDQRACLKEISLTVRAGEIIGIAGTSGNGQETLTGLISGVVSPTGGKIKLFGRVPRQMSPARFVRIGVGRVPQDCRHHGVVASLSIADNLVLEDLRTSDFETNGFLKTAAIRAHATRMLAGYGIDAPSIDTPTSELSEGDIQKLVLARVLDRNPYFIIADHPTRGLDLRTQNEVHRRLVTERAKGTAILLISEDVDELLTLSDWIGVLYEGRLTIPQPTRAFDRESLGFMMGGHGSLAQDWSGWGGAA
jgi:general nucleoside transport system ATP-binding protein